MSTRTFLIAAGIVGLAILLQPLPASAPQARLVLWEEGFEDGDADCWTIQTTGTTVSVDDTYANSGDYALEVVGNQSQGQGAVAKSRVIQIDFTRDYTLQFAFRYDSFHWNRFAIFGHIRLLIDYAGLPLLYDPVGDNSFVGNRVSDTSFETYLPSDAWGWITIHCHPADREYAVFINGAHVGSVTYQAGLTPSSQFWFEENYSSTNYLNAWYDDLKVWGYLDPQQCPYAIPGLPYDPGDCAAWVNPPQVPYHGQYTRPGNPNLSEPCCPGAPNGRCAVACLQMLFDTYGDPLPGAGGVNAGPQEEIEAAANTNDRARCPNGQWAGTSVSDARRAAHFSTATKARTRVRAGCPPQGCPAGGGAKGYTWRNDGFAAFDSVWTDLAPADTVNEQGGIYPIALETLIASGHPLIAFVNGSNYARHLQPDAYEGDLDTTVVCPPEETAPGHAILLIGYDNLGAQVGNPLPGPAFMLHDPALGKHLWISQQTLWDSVWTSKRFVFAAPWEVLWLSPARWCYSANAQGTGLITYTGPAPLDGLHPIANVSAQVSLTGIGLQGGEVLKHALNKIACSGDWDFTTWRIKFPSGLGGPANGSVACDAYGTLSPALTSTSYANYADRIGGRGGASQAFQFCLQAGDAHDFGHDGWPYGGRWWWRPGGSSIERIDLGGGSFELTATVGNYGTEPLPAGGIWQLAYDDPGAAQRAPGTTIISAETLPPLAPGEVIEVGPVVWTAPPANAFGQPYFALFSTVEHPLDPPESAWPQDENNFAVLSVFTEELQPEETFALQFLLDNPEPTEMALMLDVACEEGAVYYDIMTTPEPGALHLLPPNAQFPAELAVTTPPLYDYESGTVHVDCYLYHPSGELVRQTGGVTLRVERPASSVGRHPQARLILSQNRPNPFAEQTVIRFATPDAGRVELQVYDVAGRLVSRLLDGRVSAGWHRVDWPGTDAFGRPLSNGVFYCRLAFEGRERLNRSMILLRR